MKIRALSFINSKFAKKPIVLREKSALGDEMISFEYKSKSKLRGFFSFLKGDVLECTAPSGFNRVLKTNWLGRKVKETKIFPDKHTYVEIEYDKRGRYPLQRIKFVKHPDGSEEVLKVSKYKNGKEVYSFINNLDGTYLRFQNLSVNQVHVEGGKILDKSKMLEEGGLQSEFSKKWILPEAQMRVKPKPSEKHPDGAIVQVKAKDIDTIRAKIRNRTKNGEINIGAHLFGSIEFRNLRAQMLRFKGANWAFLNLKNWGFKYQQLNGSNPEDVINVHVFRSPKAFDYFTSFKKQKGLKIDNYHANFLERAAAWFWPKFDVKDYYRKIDDYRESEISFFSEKPDKAKYDLDFQKAAEYLNLLSKNYYYEDITERLTKKLKLKKIEYKKVDPIERSNAKAKVKAEKRLIYEAKAQERAKREAEANARSKTKEKEITAQ